MVLISLLRRSRASGLSRGSRRLSIWLASLGSVEGIRREENSGMLR
jgi:hypothetical protein